MALNSLVMLGIILGVLTFASWVLACIARRLPKSIPRALKIAVCGAIAPVVLVGVFGWWFTNLTFFEWLSELPARTYLITLAFMGAGCFVASRALREAPREVDIATFE